MTVSILAEGLEGMARYLEAMPEKANAAAARALNRVADGEGAKLLQSGIEDEIDFPTGYVAPRIFVKRKAYNNRLEAVIASRSRPTSLARFARSGVVGKAGVTVSVGRGNSTRMDRAFLIRLRAGKAPTGESSNLGLAIRLGKDERIANKKIQAKAFGGGLYLLYGPSVNQVMRTVADDKSPAILDAVWEEFLRQMNRSDL